MDMVPRNEAAFMVIEDIGLQWAPRQSSAGGLLA